MASATDIGLGIGTGGGYTVGKMLFGGGPSPIDISGLQSAIQQGAARQNQIALTAAPQQAQLNQQFQTGIQGALKNAQTTEQQQASKFLTDIGQTTDAQGNELSDVLRQKIYGALPEQEREIRNVAAATGGLGRGSVTDKLVGAEQEAASNLASGESQIELSQLQQRQKALNTVNQMNDNMVQNTLGITKDELMTLYQYGNQDVINQVNTLLGIEQNADTQNLQAQEFALSGGLAQDLAGQQNKNAIIQGLIGAGTKLGVAGMGA